MRQKRWACIAAIYDNVVELPDAQRPAALDTPCGDDIALRQEVESLLVNDGRDSPVDAPVWDAVAAVLHAGIPDLEPGLRLGAYVIEDAVGTGGMGEVYRARDANPAES